MRTHVLYVGEPGVVARFESPGSAERPDGPGGPGHGVVVEGVAGPDLVDTAVGVADAVERIELCGGVAVDVAARVRAAVPDRVEVRLNRYGFESLEQAAAYKAAYGTTDQREALFYRAPESTPLVRHGRTLVAGVADDAALVERAREARALDAGIVELYAGLGVAHAAVVRAALDGALPVGFVG